MTTERQISRRERKKLRTREEIVAAARQLFAEHGYHDTSISDIAERADLSASTVFMHFSTKSELLFAGVADLARGLIEAIESREPGESAVEATIRWHDEATEHGSLSAESPEYAWWKELRRIVSEDLTLAGLADQQWVESRDVLARAIAEDLGDRPTDLRPQLIAAAKTAFLATLAQRRDATMDWNEERRYINECFRATVRAIEDVPLASARPRTRTRDPA